MMVEPNADRIVPRRRALLLAGVGLGSLGLAACGGGDKTAEQEPRSSASETPQDSGSASPSASGEASNTPNPNFQRVFRW